MLTRRTYVWFQKKLTPAYKNTRDRLRLYTDTCKMFFCETEIRQINDTNR